MINDDMSMWNCPESTFFHRMQSTCPVDSIVCPSPFEKSERREIGTKGHVSHHGLKVNNNMEKDCLQINIIVSVKDFHIISYGISASYEPVCPGCLGCLRCSGKHLHWKRFNEMLWGETIPENKTIPESETIPVTTVHQTWLEHSAIDHFTFTHKKMFMCLKHLFLNRNILFARTQVIYAYHQPPAFLGPRGPLVEPSISVPSTRLATIFPEFIDDL